MAGWKGNKYRAKKVKTPDGLFDSMGELKRWIELQWLEKAGDIKNLQRQVTFEFNINGVKIGTYKADFSYEEVGATKPTVEEFKGFWTAEAKIKARLFQALYGNQYEYRVSGTQL